MSYTDDENTTFRDLHRAAMETYRSLPREEKEHGMIGSLIGGMTDAIRFRGKYRLVRVGRREYAFCLMDGSQLGGTYIGRAVTIEELHAWVDRKADFYDEEFRQSRIEWEASRDDQRATETPGDDTQ